MYISIPVGKRLDNITKAQTSNMTGVLRQNGKYLVGSADTQHGFAWDQGEFMKMTNLGVLRYAYNFSTPLEDAVNNDCVSLHFTGGVIQLS